MQEKKLTILRQASDFKGCQAGPSYCFNLNLCLFDSLPQTLDFSKEHNHQGHVLIDPLLK